MNDGMSRNAELEEVTQVTTNRPPHRRMSPTAVRGGHLLPSFAAALLVLNVIATVVAIVVNLPSQFGIVGTDAGAEFVMSGTAISMLIPVVSLLAVVAFAGRRDRWRWLGVAAGYFTALSVSIGGFWELTAEPTEDTPEAVLVGSGILFLAVGLALFVFSTAAAVRPPPDNRA
jgi:hypothetical protein